MKNGQHCAHIGPATARRDLGELVVPCALEHTGEQWELIEPLMPKSRPCGRGNDHRATLNGMMWVFKSGSPWRDIPARPL